MANFRFIHSADLHIDSPFHGLTGLPKNIYNEIRASTFSAFDRIIEYCIEYEVDFLLLAGDIYDLEDRSIKAQIHFLKGLEKLDQRGIKTFIIHGNHDPIDQQKAYIKWPASVHIFSADKVESIPFYKDNREAARIFGRSFPTKAFKDNIISQYLNHDNYHGFKIGMLHTNVDGNSVHDAYAPCTLRELKNAAMDYWALGHIHKSSVVAEQEPTIIYPGNPQGRHIKETGLKGCVLVEVNRNKVESFKWLPTSRIIWDEFEVDITNAETINEIIIRIEKELDKRQANYQLPLILRIVLQGNSNLHFELSKDGKAAELQEIINNTYNREQPWTFVEKLILKTKPLIPINDLLEQETFLADFIKELETAKKDNNLEKIIAELLHNRRLKRHFANLYPEDYDDISKDVLDLVINFFLKEGDY